MTAVVAAISCGEIMPLVQRARGRKNSLTDEHIAALTGRCEQVGWQRLGDVATRIVAECGASNAGHAKSGAAIHEGRRS